MWLAKVTGKMKIISSSLLTVYLDILGRWKGCNEALVRDEGLRHPILPWCSGDGLELEVRCRMREECARFWTSPKSCFGPGDQWLLSVSDQDISNYWDSNMFWGRIEYFIFYLVLGVLLLTYTPSLTNLHHPGKWVVLKNEHLKSKFTLIWLRLKELW